MEKDISDANLWYNGGALQSFYLQKDAIRSAKRSSLQSDTVLPIVIANEYCETGQRRFLAGSVEDFVAAYLESDLNSRHAYELILQNQPCKMYYDVEFDCNTRVSSTRVVDPLSVDHETGNDDEPLLNSECRGHEMTEKLIDYTLFMLDAFFNDTGYTPSGGMKRCLWSRDEVIELDSSTDTKFSRHLIFPSVIFESNKHCGEFVKFIMEERLIRPYMQMMMSSDLAELLEERSHLACHLAETDADVSACRAIRRRYTPPFWPDEFVYVQKLITKEKAAKLAEANKENVDALLVADDRTSATKHVRFVDLTVYTSNRNFRLLHSSKYGKTVRLERPSDADATNSFYSAVSDHDVLLLSLVSCVKYHLCRDPDPEANEGNIEPLRFSLEDIGREKRGFADCPSRTAVRVQLINSLLHEQLPADAYGGDVAYEDDGNLDYSHVDDVIDDIHPLDANEDAVRPRLEQSDSSGNNEVDDNADDGKNHTEEQEEEGLAAMEAEDGSASGPAQPPAVAQQQHESTSSKRRAAPVSGTSPNNRQQQTAVQDDPNAPYRSDPAVSHRRAGTLMAGSCAAYPELNEFICLLATDAQNGRESKVSQSRDSGDLITYQMKGTYRYCGNIGRHHKNNNIWFLVNVDRLCWQQRCFDCRDYRSVWIDLPVKVARRVAARRDAKFGERRAS